MSRRVTLPNAYSRPQLCSYAPATIRLVHDLDATESKVLSIVILGRIVTQGRNGKRSRINADTTLIASDVLQTAYHLQWTGVTPSRTHIHHQKKAIHA